MDEAKVYRYGSSADADQCVLLLHGFPADSGKNEDLASALSQDPGLDCYLIHYRGLGDSGGLYSFTSSLGDSEHLLKALLVRYGRGRVHMIGHSWGGQVALRLLSMHGTEVGKGLLLAPLLELPPRAAAAEIVAEFTKEQGKRGRTYSLEGLLDEIDTLRQTIPDILPSLLRSGSSDQRIHVIQGKRDVVVSPFVTRDFVAALGGRAALFEVDDDHWFSDRAALLKWCRTVLSGVRDGETR